MKNKDGLNENDYVAFKNGRIGRYVKDLRGKVIIGDAIEIARLSDYSDDLKNRFGKQQYDIIDIIKVDKEPVKGYQIEEGMQIIVDGRIVDVLYEERDFGFDTIDFVVYDHLQRSNRYFYARRNKKYQVL